MPNKFHSLLASTTEESFLKNLNLSPQDEQELLSAASEIRNSLLAGFSVLREEQLKVNAEIEVPKPKFAIQGSYAYGTMNDPANPPIQQVDIDLGMYLPFSALGDGKHPKQATTFYFKAVETILQAHINSKSMSWRLLSGDKVKDTCVRVNINPKMHIDIPLYAVPKEDMDRVTSEQMQFNKSHSLLSDTVRESEYSFDAFAVEAVSPDVICMADRKKGWMESDALVIRDWVKSHFQQHGAMIRPVCRFLKGWRDHHWQDGKGPSSIFLLAHAVHNFPKNRESMTHCDALRHLIDDLPNVFDQPLLIPCPTIDNKDAKEDLRQRIPDNEKITILQKIHELKSEYNQARNEKPETANEQLIQLFGTRMPHDPGRIEVVTETQGKIEKIRSATPDVKPLYTSERSNSG